MKILHLKRPVELPHTGKDESKVAEELFVSRDLEGRIIYNASGEIRITGRVMDFTVYSFLKFLTRKEAKKFIREGGGISNCERR